ncbi:uncharacterized protein LOC105420898 [Amborella trichopoda]|uniref:uncharacterized protein LOC105420898 n=1 Tax=Amborella trichopoda TaxID=13333 RepID=UPI0005D35C32|nr:uncharacterized protein LOC105420898 [Amborella trichopoda]|eukprot:XP_011624538.1 uncharacterized protein LOC105420898 [Amborella trichopoda]
MKLLEDVVEWNPSQLLGEETEVLSCLRVEPQLFQQVRVAQKKDPQLMKILEELKVEGKEDFSIGSDGLLRFKARIWVPNDESAKMAILEEAHHSRYMIHPGDTKMYLDLKRAFWWNNMKRDVA